MSVTIKLSEGDADLLRRVLESVGHSDGTVVDEILRRADIRAAAHPGARTTLVRLADYLETVLKAG